MVSKTVIYFAVLLACVYVAQCAPRAIGKSDLSNNGYDPVPFEPNGPSDRSNNLEARYRSVLEHAIDATHDIFLSTLSNLAAGYRAITNQAKDIVDMCAPSDAKNNNIEATKAKATNGVVQERGMLGIAATLGANIVKSYVDDTVRMITGYINTAKGFIKTAKTIVAKFYPH